MRLAWRSDTDRVEGGRWLSRIRIFVAPNPGLFTLDGTCTYVVGRERVAVVDPGPDLPAHLEVVAGAVAGAGSVRLLVTHGHGDHSGGVAGLSSRLGGAAVLGPGKLREGERVSTDAGDLVTLATPGHTRDHLTYHWPSARAAFVGDLLLGRGNTTWVAGYRGCVADYLRSLNVVAALDLEVIYPGHGPPLDNPAEALDLFRSHREDRIDQVIRAREELPGATAEGLVDAVYGQTVPSSMARPAAESIRAILDHLGEDVYPDGLDIASVEEH